MLDGWISVKDKFPESIGMYICCIDNRVTTLSYDKESPQGEFIWNNRVTHWMYLPEPPKGE
jgi:hypothetical protein